MPPPDQTIQARYRLVFSNQVKRTAFTSHPVDPIEVAIYDTCAKSNISSECFLSSAKVRLTVLSAQPWENKGENWSRSEFNKSMLRARKGKAPILTGGSLTIRLKNGLGTFGNIIFTDNSSWSNGEFRLGIMVEGEGEEGYLNGERVQEGVSEPFQVKDRRAKACQKPDLLELTHNVQSIRKVGKGRAALLQKNNIKTVENFLWWYKNKQHALREILGIKSESDQGWKSMIEHAMKCANEFHAKYNAFKERISSSGYVVPLSPCKKGKIKFLFKLITFLTGFKMRARMVPPAQYQPLENTSQPQQDLVHLNGGPLVVGSGSSEPNSFENNIIEVLPLEEDLTWMNTLQDQFGNESEDLVIHPTGRNMSLYTNDGPRIVGSGSSEPNPHENDIIEEPAIGGQLSAICGNFSMNVSIEHMSTASVEHIVETQQALFHDFNALVHPMGRNMSLCINVGPLVVGSGSSEPNPFENGIIEGDMPAFYEQLPDMCDISSMNVLNEHISTASVDHIVETQHPLFPETNHTENDERINILNGNSMQSTTGDGLTQLEIPDDLVPMEDLLANTESTSDNSLQGPSRSDSFNPGLCEDLVQGFIVSMSNSVNYVGPPLTPCKNKKIKALLRSVAFLAVPRKRARIAPPSNQTTVPAI